MREYGREKKELLGTKTQNLRAEGLRKGATIAPRKKISILLLLEGQKVPVKIPEMDSEKGGGGRKSAPSEKVTLPVARCARKDEKAMKNEQVSPEASRCFWKPGEDVKWKEG